MFKRALSALYRARQWKFYWKSFFILSSLSYCLTWRSGNENGPEKKKVDRKLDSGWNLFLFFSSFLFFCFCLFVFSFSFLFINLFIFSYFSSVLFLYTGGLNFFKIFKFSSLLLYFHSFLLLAVSPKCYARSCDSRISRYSINKSNTAEFKFAATFPDFPQMAENYRMIYNF